MREIHFYPDSRSIPDFTRYFSGWVDTTNAIEDERIHRIKTTQMGLLSTTLLVKGFRIFIHDSYHSMYEIKLGSDNDRTTREIKVSHNLFAMWKQGEFDRNNSFIPITDEELETIMASPIGTEYQNEILKAMKT